MISPKAHINYHIAICMCNSLKCWFKHPLPHSIMLMLQGPCLHSIFFVLMSNENITHCQDLRW